MGRVIVRLAIAGLAVVIAGCGSGSTSVSTSPPTSASGMTVSIVSGAQSLTTNAYSPNPVTVPVGSTVTWMNDDNTSHTSTSDTGAWTSGTLAPGARFSMTFPNAGTFPYHCTIHPNMVGTVMVQ